MDVPPRWFDHVRMAKEPSPRHFIRQWRKFRGLTLEQLAERLHTTHATLSRVETGKMDYTQPLLERLADELRTDPASLIMRDPTDPEGIWSLWDALTPVTRRTAATVLSSLRDAETPPAKPQEARPANVTPIRRATRKR